MEYEAARSELLEEIARGASVQELQARLTKKNDVSYTKESSHHDAKEPSHLDSKRIPDDLVQIQAYIRWEKAGKPNYSSDQQLVNSMSPLGLFFCMSFHFKLSFSYTVYSFIPCGQ